MPVPIGAHLHVNKTCHMFACPSPLVSLSVTAEYKDYLLLLLMNKCVTVNQLVVLDLPWVQGHSGWWVNLRPIPALQKETYQRPLKDNTFWEKRESHKRQGTLCVVNSFVLTNLAMIDRSGLDPSQWCLVGRAGKAHLGDDNILSFWQFWMNVIIWKCINYAEVQIFVTDE